MAENNINFQMKKKKDDNTWEEIYPITVIENIQTEDGTSLTDKITALKNLWK